MSTNRFRISACALLAVLSGCATIMTPLNYAVPIDSDPPGATVKLDGAALGKTPCTVSLRRNGGKGRTVLLELDGHHPREAKIRAQGNGWIVGNLLFGGPLGLIIDLAGGSYYGLSDKPIRVPMVALTEPAPEAWAPAAAPRPEVSEVGLSPGDAWRRRR